MTQRLHTDSELRDIKREDIAINTNDWPRDEVARWYRSVGMKPTQMDDNPIMGYLCNTGGIDKFSTWEEIDGNGTRIWLVADLKY